MVNIVAKKINIFIPCIMKDTIESKVKIKTDKWCGYNPLKKDFENLIQLDSGEKGGNFPEIHRVIMMFKSWL